MSAHGTSRHFAATQYLGYSRRAPSGKVRATICAPFAHSLRTNAGKRDAAYVAHALAEASREGASLPGQSGHEPCHFSATSPRVIHDP